MPLGLDKQYDVDWKEQDLIRRRQELKNRLKQEGIRKRFDPYLHIKKVLYSDPALEKYMDFRKKGRTPGGPFKPSLFFGFLAMWIVPISILHHFSWGSREPYLEASAKGDYPLEKRLGKHIM